MENQIKKLAKQLAALNKSFALLKQTYYNNDKNNYKKDKMMENKDQINIFDVANYIIRKKSELNHLRLHKIIYFSHISSLIKIKKPLIHERLEAWLYGPVFPVLYQYIKENNKGFIVKFSNKGNFKKLNKVEKQIIDDVFKEIKKYQPFEISDITHQQKPWKDKFFQPTPNWEKEITNQDLIEYFSKKKHLFETD